MFNSYVTSLKLHNTTWWAIVMEFIDGIHSKTYPEKLIDELAITQARLHVLAVDYSVSQLMHAGELHELRESFFIQQIDRSRITNRLLLDFLDRAQNYVVLLDRNLPKGLCHLDYDKENALIKDNTLVAILDFDDLALAPFIVCLAYTLWHIRQQSGQDAQAHYLSKYESIRPLSDLEKLFIKPIMLFRHYVISSIRILNNHRTPEEIHEYLALESELT